YTVGRLRFVILNKAQLASQRIIEHLLAPGLQEITALVVMHRGGDEQDIGNNQAFCFHANQGQSQSIASALIIADRSPCPPLAGFAVYTCPVMMSDCNFYITTPNAMASLLVTGG